MITEGIREVLAYADKVLPERAERGTSFEEKGMEKVIRTHGEIFAKKLVDFAASDEYLKRKGSSLAFATKEGPLKIAEERIKEGLRGGGQKTPTVGVLTPASPEIKRLYDDLMKYFNRILEFLPTNTRHGNCHTLPTHAELIERFEHWDEVRRKGKARDSELRSQEAKARAERAAQVERENSAS